MYLFDNLPLEVILYEIFPNLDYDSRVTANAMLPPQDRQSKKLTPDIRIRLQFNLFMSKMSKYMRKIDKHRGIYRNRVILAMYRDMAADIEVVKYNNNLRDTLLVNARRYIDTDSEEYATASSHVCKTLPVLCQRVIDLIQATPFVRHVSSK